MTNEISDIPTTPAPDAIEAPVLKQKPNFGSLRMIGHFTIKYPRQIAYALLALIAAASSTLAIPYGLRLIIDEGFAKNGGDPAPYFYLLLGIVVVIGVSTAFRFYFVSWLGERVVGDIRVAVQSNLLRLAPRFFEENRPGEIASRMTADTAIIEQIVGTQGQGIAVSEGIADIEIGDEFSTERLPWIFKLIRPRTEIILARIDRKIANSILIKVNQIGTLTETLNAISLASF